MKVQVTRKVIKMTYQQKEQSQQDSRVWVIGKAGKQRANIGGPAIVSLAATSLLSPTPLKFLQIYSQTRIWAAVGMPSAFSANAALRPHWRVRTTDLVPLETRSLTE